MENGSAKAHFAEPFHFIIHLFGYKRFQKPELEVNAAPCFSKFETLAFGSAIHCAILAQFSYFFIFLVTSRLETRYVLYLCFKCQTQHRL
jgi:hypothetical protein